MSDRGADQSVDCPGRSNHGDDAAHDEHEEDDVLRRSQACGYRSQKGVGGKGVGLDSVVATPDDLLPVALELAGGEHIRRQLREDDQREQQDQRVRKPAHPAGGAGHRSPCRVMGHPDEQLPEVLAPKQALKRRNRVVSRTVCKPA